MSPYIRFCMQQEHNVSTLSEGSANEVGEGTREEKPTSNCSSTQLGVQEAIANIENYEYSESFDVIVNISDINPNIKCPGYNVLNSIKGRQRALMNQNIGSDDDYRQDNDNNNIDAQLQLQFKEFPLREDIIANPKVYTAIYEFPTIETVSSQEQIKRMFDLTKIEEDEKILNVPLSELKYIPSKEWKHARFANLTAELYIWLSALGYPEYSGHQPLWINENLEIVEGTSTFTSIKYNFLEDSSLTIPCILKGTGVSTSSSSCSSSQHGGLINSTSTSSEVLLSYVEEIAKILDFRVNINEDIVYEYVSTTSSPSKDDPDKLSTDEKRYSQIKFKKNEGIFYVKYIETFNDGTFVSTNEILCNKLLKSKQDISDSFADIINSSYMISYYDSIILYNNMKKIQESEESFNLNYYSKTGYYYMGQYKADENEIDTTLKIYLRKNTEEGYFDMISC